MQVVLSDTLETLQGLLTASFPFHLCIENNLLTDVHSAEITGDW